MLLIFIFEGTIGKKRRKRIEDKEEDEIVKCEIKDKNYMHRKIRKNKKKNIRREKMKRNKQNRKSYKKL